MIYVKWFLLTLFMFSTIFGGAVTGMFIADAHYSVRHKLEREVVRAEFIGVGLGLVFTLVFGLTSFVVWGSL